VAFVVNFVVRLARLVRHPWSPQHLITKGFFLFNAAVLDLIS
jgi:hypothetical protein